MLWCPKLFFILNLVVRVIYSQPPDILNHPSMLRLLLQNRIMVGRNVLTLVLCILFGICLGFIDILLHFPQGYRFLILNSCKRHFQPPPAKWASSLLSKYHGCTTMYYIHVCPTYHWMVSLQKSLCYLAKSDGSLSVRPFFFFFYGNLSMEVRFAVS